MDTAAAVLRALDEVHDPEVDRPVTEMGFIRDVVVDGDAVLVHMQLPTYFCAPNFTYLMVEDVRLAAEQVVGEGRVVVDLEGHFESDAINAGSRTGSRFSQVFPLQAVEDLDQLRDRFRRKTFLIRQELVCQELVAMGVDAQSLTRLSLGEVAGHRPATYARYLTTRGELGIACRPGAQFLVAADGRSVGPDRLRAHRRSAAVMAVSFQGNGHLCQSLLAQRYPTHQPHPMQPHPIQQGDVA